jgi:hypothetical protein
MFATLCATDEVLTQTIASKDSNPVRPRRRYDYRRVEGSWVKNVIVDIGPDGEENWGEQYPGEIRWYPFTPSAAERQMILRWHSGDTDVPRDPVWWV